MIVDNFVGSAWWLRIVIYAGFGWLSGGALVLSYLLFIDAYRALKADTSSSWLTFAFAMFGLAGLIGLVVLGKLIFAGDSHKGFADIFTVLVFMSFIVFLSHKEGYLQSPKKKNTPI
jgi:MFS family permease